MAHRQPPRGWGVLAIVFLVLAGVVVLLVFTL
jgi:hypothetical protein